MRQPVFLYKRPLRGWGRLLAASAVAMPLFAIPAFGGGDSWLVLGCVVAAFTLLMIRTPRSIPLRGRPVLERDGLRVDGALVVPNEEIAQTDVVEHAGAPHLRLVDDRGAPRALVPMSAEGASTRAAWSAERREPSDSKDPTPGDRLSAHGSPRSATVFTLPPTFMASPAVAFAVGMSPLAIVSAIWIATLYVVEAQLTSPAFSADIKSVSAIAATLSYVVILPLVVLLIRARATLRVGDDGLEIQQRRATRFIAYHTLASFKAEQGRLILTFHNGESLSLAAPAGLEAVRDHVEAMWKRSQASRTAEGHAWHPPRAKEGPDVRTLRALVDGAGASPRSAGVSVDALLNVALDMDASADDRVAAVAALSSVSLSAEDRARLEAVRDASASTRVRVAVDTVLEAEEDEEAVVEALAALLEKKTLTKS